MSAFRALLAVIFGVIVVYTAIVVANHGFGLFPVFFGTQVYKGFLHDLEVSCKDYSFP